MHCQPTVPCPSQGISALKAAAVSAVCMLSPQDLMSVRVTQDIRTLASLKRWNRNVAADSSSRLSHAEAFAQRAQVAFNPDRRGSQAEGSAQGQPLSLSPLNNDTVLTFSVHRFDR